MVKNMRKALPLGKRTSVRTYLTRCPAWLRGAEALSEIRLPASQRRASSDS
jgi:hypothetical protein